MLRRIAAIPEPAQRLETLRVFTLSAYMDVGSSHDPVLKARQFPLGEVLDIAIEGVAAVRQRLITAEESGYLRNSVDSLLRSLNALLLIRFGALTPDSIDAGCAMVESSQVDPNEWEVISQYGRLLRSMMNWRLGFYAARQFREALHCLLPKELAEFTEIRNELAAYLWESFTRPTVLQSPILPERLDRIRELRTLAQAVNDPRTSVESPSSIPSGCACIFLVEMLPAPHHRFGLVGVEADRIHLWWSERWSALADECHRLLQSFDVETRRFDQLAASLQGTAEFQLDRMLSDDARRIQRVLFQNLTAFHVPLDCLADSNGHDRIMSGLASTSERIREHRISFWGQMQFRSHSVESADESSRIVALDGEEVLRYPDLPAAEIRRKGAPTPLPFAFYERWLLEDLSRSPGIQVEFHTGNSATRTAFLSADWQTVSVLHVTTHGFARPAFELSNLMFAQEGGSPTRVHFLDILSGDWSGLELVFLNVCLSQAGQKLIGESALSLAWAFLAGGARSVIACRWQVEDALAWCFAQHFYQSWLIEKPRSSVLEAFHEARRAVQRYPQFRKTSQWGAFVLLERPDSAI